MESKQLQFSWGEDSLHNAVLSGFPTELEEIYQKHPEQLDEVDALGCTPLGHAILADNLSSVEWLLEKGADVNVQMVNGKTAAMIAIIFERTAIFEKLLQHRLDADITDDQGNTLLDVILSLRDWDALRLMAATKM